MTPPRKTYSRSLGEFFGHIWRAVKTAPAQPDRAVLRHDVAEERRDTPHGKVTLRRTTIEEIQVDRPNKEG